MIGRLLRWSFYAVLVRPLVMVVLGLHVRHRERLPTTGPAILTANHNSHLDAMVLTSLLPLSLLPRIRPAAAADYFLKNRLLAWFAREVIGILPVRRGSREGDEDPLAAVSEAVEGGDLVIFFPEGTRGAPETLSRFRKGLAYLAERHPQAAVIPIFLHGLGKSMPKGAALPVPFFCDVFVGEPVPWCGERDRFMADYTARMEALAAEWSAAAGAAAAPVEGMGSD
jgi:1-acyl-sn-glycerol-3-phosphate acyltransferase